MREMREFGLKRSDRAITNLSVKSDEFAQFVR